MLPVQQDREGVMRRARDLVDCRVSYLATCFAFPPKDKRGARDEPATPGKEPPSTPGGGAGGTGVPALLPQAVAENREELLFLEKLGLRKDIQDLPFLIMCARSLARVQQVWKAQGDASGVIVKDMVEAGLVLFEALEKFKGEDGLLAQLGRVPFVPVFHSKRSYAFPAASTLPTFPLCSIKDLSSPSLSRVQSLVRPVLHTELEACHKSLEAVLWPVGELDHDGHVVCTIQQLRRYIYNII